MRMCSVKDLKPGDVLGKSIVHSNNRLLLGAGFRITNLIKEKLIEKNGFYYYQESSSAFAEKTKEDSAGFPFIISGEISLIYTQEKGRRIHLVLLVPNIETAEKVADLLSTVNNYVEQVIDEDDDE